MPLEEEQALTDEGKALADKDKALADKAKALANSNLKATLTFNKQVRGADGSLTVTALELKIAGGGESKTISVASATCNAVSSATPTPTTQPVGNEAPAPTPVTFEIRTPFLWTRTGLAPLGPGSPDRLLSGTSTEQGPRRRSKDLCCPPGT